MSLASVKQEGRTLTIMNNNPSKRGALSLELYAAINEALERAQDPEIRAVISTLEERREKIQDLHDITAGIRACPVPVIAAVEGGAAGAGLSLALACDMIVAAPGAKLTASYVKAGVVPDGGLTSALSRMIARRRASSKGWLAKLTRRAK